MCVQYPSSRVAVPVLTVGGFGCHSADTISFRRFSPITVVFMSVWKPQAVSLGGRVPWPSGCDDDAEGPAASGVGRTSSLSPLTNSMFAYT